MLGRRLIAEKVASRRHVRPLTALLPFLMAGASVAEIDLELRPEATCLAPGELVEVGLYAVSDDQTEQSISAIDAVLVWDAESVAFVGNEDNGPYVWLGFDPFQDDSLLDGLNDTWEDGNALYTVLADFGDPAMATPEGLLVTTLQFEVLRDAVRATVGMLDLFGEYSYTRVYSGESPNELVTGILVPTEVTVQRDLARSADLSDFALLQDCFAGEGETASSSCACWFDYDADADVDLEDFGEFLAEYDGPQGS